MRHLAVFAKGSGKNVDKHRISRGEKSLPSNDASVAIEGSLGPSLASQVSSGSSLNVKVVDRNLR